MELSRQIQRLRRKMALSQENLAEQMGVSRQAISKWESGAAIPEVDKLIQLARFFGVTVDELLGVTPPAPEAAGDTVPIPTSSEPADAPAETAPNTEERLRAMEGLAASLAEEQHRQKKRRWLVMLPAALLVIVLLAQTRQMHRELEWMEDRVSRLSATVDAQNTTLGNWAQTSAPEPTDPDPVAGRAVYLDVDPAARTVRYRVTTTLGEWGGQTTAELLLVRADGTAETFPVEVVGGTVCQGEVAVPWIGESEVSLVLTEPETGIRRNIPVYVFRSPGQSLALNLQSIYGGRVQFPEGKVRFGGMIEWQNTFFEGERLPVENRAVSACVVVTVDGETVEEIPIKLENTESQWSSVRVPFEREYPLAAGQQVTLTMLTIDSFDQEYREILGQYTAGAANQAAG